MKKGNDWRERYTRNPKAANLLIAGGVARLLAVLLLIPAVWAAITIIATLFQPALAGMPGLGFWYVLDEMDDELEAAFFLGAGAALCGYAAHVLRCKASLLLEKE